MRRVETIFGGNLTASLCDAIAIPEPFFDGPLSAGTTHLLFQYRQAQTGPLV
jgi:hypothetical protein